MKSNPFGQPDEAELNRHAAAAARRGSVERPTGPAMAARRLRTSAWVALAALGAFATSSALAFTRQEVAQGFRDDLVIAKPRAEFRESTEAAESAEGLSVHRRFSRVGPIRVLRLASTETARAAIARLRASGRYEYVEPDRLLFAKATPNDPLFAQQWALANTGQSGGTIGADIGALGAWNTRTDATGNAIVVAIVDSGIRLTHADLAANLWTGSPRGNHGINAQVSSVYPKHYQPTDEDGHGTHVAGIVGAVGNNSVGTTGVAWSAKLMALRFMDSSGTGSTSDEIECIEYAIANGAKIINASYGSESYSIAEYDALKAARDAGVIVVAAAGNDGADNDALTSYPSGYALDNIVAVASTNRRDELSGFSNYGSGSVDLAAPGEDILSTYHTSDSATTTLSGTSMAAPQVTGAVALLRAQFPSDTYRQTINRLLRSAKRLPALTGKVHTGARLDLAQALTSTSNLPFNDRLSEAATLAGVNVRGRASNTGATGEAGEPAHAGVAGASTSLWWSWTAPETTQVAIDTTGSDYDTVLAIYTGATVAGLQSVASNDDATAGQTTSRVLLAAVAGTTYRIAVAGKAGASGYTALHVGSIPANDAYTAAKTVSGNAVRVVASNRNGTREAGEPTIVDYGMGHSVWYRWTAPTTGRYSAAVHSSILDTLVGVYTGGTLATLSPLATNDDCLDLGTQTSADINTDALVTFDAVAGTVYSVLVDHTNSDGTDGDSFVLTISDAIWQSPSIDEVTSSPAVASDGSVYFGSTDGAVYGIGSDGVRKWRYDIGEAFDGSSPAIGSDGTIYIGANNGYLYALNPNSSSQRLRWRFSAGGPITSTPAIGADGTIYVRDDTTLYAIKNTEIAFLRKWTYPLNESTTGGTYASPTVAPDGTVYVGTTGGDFLALKDSGSIATLKWKFTADGDIYTSAAIGADGAIHFATLSGTVYALEPGGTQRWSWSAGAGNSVTSSLAIAADGTVYFGGYDKKLHALDRRGVERWSAQLGDEVRASSPALAADGTIYLGCYDGLLYAFRDDGTLARTYPTGGRIRSSPAIAGNRLYFGSADAKIHAYDLPAGPQASAWPMFQQGALHQARGLGTATSISAQPQSRTVETGNPATFAVTASSSLALSYQWYKDGVALPGATGASLSLAATTAANAGTYTVAIVSATGTVTSAGATLVVTGAPTIGAQPVGTGVAAGASAQLAVVASGNGLSYEWYRGGVAVSGNASAGTATLALPSVTPDQAGIYDCIVTSATGGHALTLPAVVGVVPVAGSRTAGAVFTRDEWQNIRHPNGNTYDQFLLTGSAGTFTADTGEIARMSFLDANGSIVQAEMSGRGAVTIALASPVGPVAPSLYNQSGILYMQGVATVIISGADSSTHVSLYSVGPGNNPGVVRADVTYNGWANIAAVGVVGDSLGGIHMGNGHFSAGIGIAGFYAPGVMTVAQQPLVLHDIDATGTAQPYLYCGSGAGIQFRIAGGDLAQSGGDAITVSGLSQVKMAAGQSSAGIAAPAQNCAAELTDVAGTVLNSTLVVGP